jgi:hypothetical protein
MNTKSNEAASAEEIRELSADELEAVAGGVTVYQIAAPKAVASPYAIKQYPALTGSAAQASFNIARIQVLEADAHRS